MTTEAEIDPAYRAARARLEERRNHWTTYSEAEHLRAKLEGRTLRESSIADPDFRPAATASEAWDDLVVRTGKPTNRGIPEYEFLAALAAAARDGGADGAVKAVKAARQLTPAQQAATYKNLELLKKDAGFADVERVFSAAIAEWERLGLAQLADEQAETYRKSARKGRAA
jgi:hypothetical protein